jgi:hypothetical protein
VPRSRAISALQCRRFSTPAIRPAKEGGPRTAFVRANGGWFGAQQTAPDLPRDTVVLGREDENRYVGALERNGFFGPDSWYMNAEANAAFAERAKRRERVALNCDAQVG